MKREENTKSKRRWWLWIVLLLLFLLIGGVGLWYFGYISFDSRTAAEVVEEVVEEQTVFQVVEQQPEFPGGMKALMKYLQDNINYPRVSRDNNSQGRAFIRFVVNTDGSIQGTEVLKSSGDMYLDKEAVRVVSGMPKWKPGRQSGKNVRVYFTLPVVFKLQ